MLALNKGGFVMVSKHQIVIIGGGTAGITVAARLRRTDRALDIALIEPSSKHYYQPLWTLVGAGVVKKETTEHEESRYIPRGVKWIKDYVEDVDPDSNRVITRNGDEIHYDYLVVAPGIQLNWDKVKGLKETLGKNGVCSNYSYELVDYTWET
jgi:sulfide:quinone oxidoreductase